MPLFISYLEVASTGSESPHDDIRPLHASVRTEAEANPACCVNHKFECNGPLHVVETPLQADQMVLVQVFHEGQAGVRCPHSFTPDQAQVEEKKQRAHDVSARLEISRLSLLPAGLPKTLPPSTGTPALLDGLSWYRQKVLSHVASACFEQQVLYIS